ncbi:MAG TPA: ATP-binding protein [Chthoniobacteraceae bacterium]|nr:ATP-binding protein [Opitutaceae bacterium]HWB58071.1 ATP-binding protein [Chthoniobacteraceae bacterium]
MESTTVFRKVLSLNDTGETGAHVAGLLVPKTDLSFFPALDLAEKNPRAEVVATDPDGRTWSLNFIYYNNEFFGGTRNEYRLTGLTAFFSANDLHAGDAVVLEKNTAGIRIRSEKAEDTGQSLVARQQWLGLSGEVADASVPAAEKNFHSIRPAARLIHTIGQNLIKDPQAAVIELVKNAYDADAHTVIITFKTGVRESSGNVRIIVEDDGHGMTYEQVTGTWLVPATADKLTRRLSPGGRPMQGNKGIGRFAAFVLGEEIFLRTATASSNTETSLLLQASDFRTAEFLDQVRILVEKRAISGSPRHGTLFEMTVKKGEEVYREWSRSDFGKLRLDLQRMLFPLNARNAEDFQVLLVTEGFDSIGQPDGTEEIEPLPVMDQFDYRIAAEIDSTGHLTGVFQSPLLVGRPEETLDMVLTNLPGVPCGPIKLDLRVIDRETASLHELIDRSKSRGDLLGDTTRAQLKRMLDESCGIMVFRGDFRIRPYGDQGDDWMGLDRDRINNPTFAISNNQTFGVVSIAPEPESHLEEKSARDGLREDEHYERLKAVVKAIVNDLQERRFSIRRAVGRIQRAPRVGEMLAELRDYERPVARITSFLKNEGVAQGKIEEVEALLREEQKAREEIVAKLEETIAIYQGQATLGKVVGIVLHEGNRAIGILRTQSRRIPELLDELREGPSPIIVDEVLRAMDSVRSALVLVSALFDRIQPLGVRARAKKAPIRLRTAINQVLGAFEEQVKAHAVTVAIDVPEGFEVIAWENDLKAIFYNLVENSVYWLTHPLVPNPTIGFRVEVDEGAGLRRLHITDNGPGIPREHIATEDIFEPHFSLRGGIGLGLPIAGEAATRNGYSLKAVHGPVGAHFILDFSPLTKNA